MKLSEALLDSVSFAVNAGKPEITMSLAMARRIAKLLVLCERAQWLIHDAYEGSNVRTASDWLIDYKALGGGDV